MVFMPNKPPLLLELAVPGDVKRVLSFYIDQRSPPAARRSGLDILGTRKCMIWLSWCCGVLLGHRNDVETNCVVPCPRVDGDYCT
jgi:hypothetical protein